MPALPNARQELYCKHRANGFVPKKAAQAAGYATGSAIYSELEGQAEIVARVHELIDERQQIKDARAEAARQAAQVSGEITGTNQAWVIEQLKLNVEEARESGDFKESTAALIKIGEHLGMWGKTSEGDAHNGRGSVADQLINESTLDKLIAATDALHAEDPPALAAPDQSTIDNLIAGHGPHPRTAVPAAARRLTTGSETDVALERDDEDDIPC